MWAAFLALIACAGPPEGSSPPETYRVRAQVRQLPVETRAVQELVVRHEAIPEFKDMEGEVVGMESMTMPFPVDDPELLTGIEPGDRIELDFEVRWDDGNPLTLTAVSKLPPETRLSFEADAAAE
ncbi:MAG: copper-binding protein [Acidobacteriota bacterium]